MISSPCLVIKDGRLEVKQLGLLAVVLVLAACSKTSSVPECQSADVLNLVRDIIKRQPAAQVLGIDEVRIHYPAEIRFERHDPPRRVCRAELETDLGREAMIYEVSWQDKAKGIIWVEVKEQ